MFSSSVFGGDKSTTVNGGLSALPFDALAMSIRNNGLDTTSNTIVHRSNNGDPSMMMPPKLNMSHLQSNNSTSMNNLRVLDNEIGYKSATAQSPAKPKRKKNQSAKNIKMMSTQQLKRSRGKQLSGYQQQNGPRVMSFDQQDKLSPELQISHKQVALIGQYV